LGPLLELTQSPPPVEPHVAKDKPRIQWYRCPVASKELRTLNQCSNVKGFLQAGGHLALLAVTGSAAYFSAGRLPWPAMLIFFFIHGTCYRFLINGFHELVHESVFKTRWPNRFFLVIYSFLGWYNHIYFWKSHTEHHKYTLHPPDDLEVVAPVPVSLKAFLHCALVDLQGFYNTLKVNIRLSFGRLNGPWEHALFPESEPVMRRRFFNWGRIVLVGHTVITIACCYFDLWLLPIVICLGPFYAGGLQYLCDKPQHVGLPDNVSDFRLCCRTVIVNPLFRFLHWNMDYHIEHHMYAGVPCYNLSTLHKLVLNDMPHCPHGLYECWTQIAAILKRQRQDPDYTFVPQLPNPADTSKPQALPTQV